MEKEKKFGDFERGLDLIGDEALGICFYATNLLIDEDNLYEPKDVGKVLKERLKHAYDVKADFCMSLYPRNRQEKQIKLKQRQEEDNAMPL